MNKILKRLITTALFVVMFTMAFKSTTPVQAATPTVTITYNANGGVFQGGRSTAQQIVKKDAYVRLTPPSVTRKGYVLLGYALNDRASYPGYLLCNQYKFSYSYTLYAVWAKNSEIYDRYGNSFSYGVDMGKVDNLNYFWESSWNKATQNVKANNVRNLISRLARLYGLSSVPNLVMYIPQEYDQENTYGVYNESAKTVFLNPKLFTDRGFIVNKKFVHAGHMMAKTIAHELRHAYQHQKAKNPHCRTDYLYAYNLGYYGYGAKNYIEANKTNYNEYQDQLVEAEAFGIEKLLDPYLK